MGFWAGFLIGVSLPFAALALACVLCRPSHAAPVEHEQDRQAIRQAEIARRREQFATVTLPQVNIGAIIQIESAGNPRAVSPARCRGLCQIAEATWKECTERMGVTWSWETDAWDPGCNRAVGNYYINRRIPEMLRHYGINDTVTTRIGAYNWGIGNFRRAWQRHGHDWLAYAPRETQRYLLKYAELIAAHKQSE